VDPRFAVRVVVVSASGALAPGPLTAATAALGARRGWRAGLGVAVGHTLVELPLVLAIALGLAELLANPLSTLALGVAGGAFMVLFGVLTLRSAWGGVPSGGDPGRGAVATGAALSLFNPLFVMWWLGVGAPLVAEALPLGPLGLLELYAVHVWLDYAWLTAVAAAGSLARLNARAYKLTLTALALAVLYLGLSTLARALGLAPGL